MYPNPKFDNIEEPDAASVLKQMFENPPFNMEKQEFLDKMMEEGLSQTGVSLVYLAQELKLFGLSASGLSRLLKEGAVVSEENNIAKILLPSVRHIQKLLSAYEEELRGFEPFSDEGKLNL